jgi:hypothetical protein
MRLSVQNTFLHAGDRPVEKRRSSSEPPARETTSSGDTERPTWFTDEPDFGYEERHTEDDRRNTYQDVLEEMPEKDVSWSLTKNGSQNGSVEVPCRKPGKCKETAGKADALIDKNAQVAAMREVLMRSAAYNAYTNQVGPGIIEIHNICTAARNRINRVPDFWQRVS